MEGMKMINGRTLAEELDRIRAFLMSYLMLILLKKQGLFFEKKYKRISYIKM